MRLAATALPLVGSMLLAALLWVAPAGPARAASTDDFAARVPDLADRTWLDLLRPIFPDIAAAPPPKSGAVAGKMIDLRSIGSGDDSWIRCGDTIELTGAAAEPVRLAGRIRLIVTLSFADDCATPLAMFDTDGRLIQVVNVRGDQHAAARVDHANPIGRGGALVTATNWHDNSNQSYNIDTLILARLDGFTVIGDILTFGDRFCRQGMTQQAKIRVLPDRGAFARITGTVTRRVQKYAEDCETKQGRPAVSLFRGEWRWNLVQGAYQAHTTVLDALAAANAKRF